MSGAWARIIAAYPPEKRRWDRTYPWIYYGARPLSFPLTWLALRLRLSPNQVTLLSFVSGLGAFALMVGGGGGLVAGSCLFALLNILDCVDGNLARMRKEESPVGRFYDQAVGLVFYLVYVALGAGLYRTPDESLSLILAPLGVEKPEPVAYLLVGLAGSLARYLGFHLQYLFHSVLGPSWEEKKAEEHLPGPTAHWSYRLYYNVIDVQAQDPVLIAAAATGLAGLFLAASAVVQVLNLLFLAAYYLRRAHALGLRAR